MNKFIVMSLFAIGTSNLYGDYGQNPNFRQHPGYYRQQTQQGFGRSSGCPNNQCGQTTQFRNYNGSQSMPYYTINEEAFKADADKNAQVRKQDGQQAARQQYYYYGSDNRNESYDDDDDDNTYDNTNSSNDSSVSDSWFNTRSADADRNRDQEQSQNADSKNDNYATEGDRRLGQRIRDAIKGGWFSKGYEQVQLDVNNGVVTLRGFVVTLEDKKNVEDTVRKVNGVSSVKNNLDIRKPSDRSTDIKKNQYERAQSANVNPSRNRNLIDDRNNNPNDTTKNPIALGDKNQYEKKDANPNKGSPSPLAESDSWFNTSKEASSRSYTNDSDKDSYSSWFGTSKDQASGQDKGTTDADRQLNKKIREALGKGWFVDKYENIQLNTANGVVTIQGFVATYDDHRKLNDEIRKVEGVRSVNNQAQVKKDNR